VNFAAPGRLDVTLHTENRTISLRGEIATGMHSGRTIRFEKIDAEMPAGIHVAVPRITGTAQTLFRLQPQGAPAESTCFGFARDAEIENPLPEPEWQPALVPAIEVPDRIYYQRCPSLEEIKRGQTTTGGQHQ
jgi:hypothetical protein